MDELRRFQAVKRYWSKRGGIPKDAEGNGVLTWEMEQEALAALQPGAPKPSQNVAHAGTLEMVAPGEGRLTAAILCPGPSLPETWPKGEHPRGYDVVIAVNNAAEHAPCDWWSAQDHGPLKNFKARPLVGICTSGANCDTLVGDRPWMPGGMSTEELDALTIAASNRLVHEDAPRRGGWSTCNAIILAARLGARCIDLYGDDKSGRVYFDGLENKATKPGRWARETRDQTALVEALSAVGVVVRNIQTKAEG
jgi:hypothetical protein